MSKGEYTALKLNQVVQDVLVLDQSKMKQADMGCSVVWDPHFSPSPVAARFSICV